VTPLTRRATIEFRRATPAQLDAGRAWYAEANDIARDQADEFGVTIETASGIIAALSPRLGWGQNVMLAERVLSHHGTLQRGALGRSLAQANAIYAGAAPLDVLGGPKTRAFYTGILTAGTEGGAVIDRHAWDMLTGIRGATPPTLKQYRTAADVMHRAAEILGETVHTVQATTWLAWRSRWWSERAFALNIQPTLPGARAWV
jgi:hypothetical protein